MITKTLVIAAVLVATIAALAIAPVTQNAEATHREGHEGNPKTETTTTCVHNGNLQETACPPKGKSSQQFTQTCTGHGNHIECTTSP